MSFSLSTRSPGKWVTSFMPWSSSASSMRKAEGWCQASLTGFWSWDKKLHDIPLFSRLIHFKWQWFVSGPLFSKHQHIEKAYTVLKHHKSVFEATRVQKEDSRTSHHIDGEACILECDVVREDQGLHFKRANWNEGWRRKTSVSHNQWFISICWLCVLIGDQCDFTKCNICPSHCTIDLRNASQTKTSEGYISQWILCNYVFRLLQGSRKKSLSPWTVTMTLTSCWDCVLKDRSLPAGIPILPNERTFRLAGFHTSL